MSAIIYYFDLLVLQPIARRAALADSPAELFFTARAFNAER